MISSTRICIAPNCSAQSRLIQSIKELDYHKGHSSSSLGQLSKKIKDLIPDFPITESTKSIIESKCLQILDFLNKKSEQYNKKCEKFELIEAASKFINQEFQLLNEKTIDLIVKALPNNFQETLETQTIQYCELQIQISQELDQLCQLLLSMPVKNEQQIQQPVTTVQTPQKKQLSQVQAAAIPIAITEKPQFIKMPEAYDKLTQFEINGSKLKHVQGYPAFVMTNQLLKEGCQVKFEIISIQEEYVGIGIGVMEKKAIEKQGLILNGEQMQNVGNGLYMNFNDKCVYNSQIENGAINGRDKGISYLKGDKISLNYNQGQLTFQNKTQNQSYQINIEFDEMIFVVWLDLSEIKII